MSKSEPASSKAISLSQAVLAPLDAVFKAQIHAARSYLNMLMQIAYPHLEVDENGNVKDVRDMDLKKPYNFPISFETNDSSGQRTTTINIPGIALVPVTPLGIEEANIRMAMSITEIAAHQQLQPAERKNLQESDDDAGFNSERRPWFLVECPVSLRGNVVAKDSASTSIEISIKLSRTPIPAALEKTLTVLTQTINTQTT